MESKEKADGEGKKTYVGKDERGRFVKGHPKFYSGKKFNYQRFVECYTEFQKHEMSFSQFAREMNVGRETLRHYLKTLWSTGILRNFENQLQMFLNYGYLLL